MENIILDRFFIHSGSLYSASSRDYYYYYYSETSSRDKDAGCLGL